jgi:AcrR family transcriptional regulator
VVTTVPHRTDAREQLVRAGERLFASRGIDGVSLREINRAAGQRNTTALQYHFGDRDGLVRAIVEKHRADTEPRRHALLDRYEVDDDNDLHTLASALVLPLAAKLGDLDGGREYLQINCELYTRTSVRIEMFPRKDRQSSIRRWHDLANAALSEEEDVLHFRFPAIRFAFLELSRRAAEPPRRDDRLFTSHLTDLVAALLATRSSPTTARLLRERNRSKR